MTAATEQLPSAPEPITTFDSIVSDKSIVSKLTAMGLINPTAVQAQTIPQAILGKDLVVQAQTGSGKTLAFVLPLLLKLQSIPKHHETFGLIVTPTRELANQVTKVMAALSDDVKPVCLIGGASSRDQSDDLGEDRRVVVGTPGRILDFLKQRKLNLRKCGYFVLDEADEMLSMGFLEDVRSILSRLPDVRQGLFISATITPRVQMLAQSFLKRATEIVVKSESGSAPEIEHFYCEIGGEITAKATALCDIIETQRPTATIIFCNTKSDTELVEVYLRRRGFEARRINSDLSQNQRDRIMNSLRSGELPILIATDVAARGIDVEDLSLVINYSLHPESETYVHRTGRTGRAGKKGSAISLVSPLDFGPFYQLRRKVTIEIKKMELPTEQEVSDARLAHFYEIVRESKVVLTDKERGIAKHFLKDLGDIEEPSEEMVEVIAKLYSLTLQSVAKAQTPIDEVADKTPPRNSGRGDENRGEERRERPQSSNSRGRNDNRSRNSDRNRR